jgi:flagellar hook-basal body complex protein FliE
MTIDKVNPAAAAGAYANIQRVAQSGGVSAGTPSFGDVLKNFATDAVETLHKSEKVSAAAVTGKADLVDVVTATDNAEMTLSTMKAFRDRVLSAYQEIMRTQM